MSTSQRQQRVHICSRLLRRHEKERFLNLIVTGDEKWIVYQNVERKRQWVDQNTTPKTTARAGLHPRNILLSVWWDISGIFYFELLDPNETLTAVVYCHQLTKLNAELMKERPLLLNRRKVSFRYDNARPRTAKLTKAKLQKLDWKIMPHPAYSPDTASSDYHLFRSLQLFLCGEKFENRSDIERSISSLHQRIRSFFLT